MNLEPCIWIMTDSISSFHSPGTRCSLNSLFSRNCLSWMADVWILTSHIPFPLLIHLWLTLLLNRWGPFSRHISISDSPATHFSALLSKEEAGYCTPIPESPIFWNLVIRASSFFLCCSSTSSQMSTRGFFSSSSPPSGSSSSSSSGSSSSLSSDSSSFHPLIHHFHLLPLSVHHH